jgi:8-oxo-dGTP pyrophosphatase MutT (NUDIX family)
MENENPWKTLESRLVYKNAWMQIREDAVIRPDGKPGIYGVVEKGAATAVVPLDDEGYTYLVGQYRYPIGCYSWEVPEGGAEQGENPLHAIQRELREETGLEAELWQQLGPRIQLSNCISNELGYMYLARQLRSGSATPEGTEVLQVKRLPFEEALRMARDGRIEDSLSIIALERTAAILIQEAAIK